jgi:hypothetical protein
LKYKGNRRGTFPAENSLNVVNVLDKVLQIRSLENAIRRLHRCGVVHVKTVFVDERFEGQTMWQGDVEVFEVFGIARVNHCYVIPYPERGGEFRPVFLLSQWPVTSPQTAVQTMISLDGLKQPHKEVAPGFDRLGSTPD